MGLRKRRTSISYRRACAEETLHALKVRLRREIGLRDAEVHALLKLLHGEALSAHERKQAAQGAREVVRRERRAARQIIAAFRGDRASRDIPQTLIYADDILAEMQAAAGAREPEGLIPELADSGAEYVSTDRGVVHPRLVNVDDMTADVRACLGTVLALA